MTKEAASPAGTAAADQTTVDVKAEGTATVTSVTTEAANAPVTVTADGNSTISTVKVSGDATATVSGTSKNTTTVDVTGASDKAKVTVNTDSVKVETKEGVKTDDIIDNKSGKELSTTVEKTDGTKTETTTKTDSSSSGSGGSGGGSSSGGGSITPSGSTKGVTSVTLDKTEPKVGDTITATVEPTDAKSVSYQWYTVSTADPAVETEISGQTDKTLDITEAMLGSYIKVVVSGANSSSATKTTTSVVGNPTITLNQPTEGGSIEVSATSAAVGDPITLTATPDSGFDLGAWVVTKKGDASTKVTVTGNSFTMPAYSVEVTATFAADGSLDNAITVKNGSTDITSAIASEDSPYTGFDVVSIANLAATAKSGDVNITYAKKDGESSYGGGTYAGAGTYKVTFSVSGATSAYKALDDVVGYITVGKATATASFAKSAITVVPSETTGYDLTSNTLSVKMGEDDVASTDYTATYKVKGPSDSEFQDVADESSVTLANGETTVQVSFESADYTIATVTFTATVETIDLSSAIVDASGITPSGEDGWDTSGVAPTVTLEGGTLTKTTNYTVSGSYTAENAELNDPAYYTLTITGIDDYTGTVSKYYYEGSWHDGMPDAK